PRSIFSVDLPGLRRPDGPTVPLLVHLRPMEDDYSNQREGWGTETGSARARPGAKVQRGRDRRVRRVIRTNPLRTKPGRESSLVKARAGRSGASATRSRTSLRHAPRRRAVGKVAARHRLTPPLAMKEFPTAAGSPST